MDVIRKYFKNEKKIKQCCETPNVIEVNHRVCENCGTVVGPIFVARYNHNARPLYIYSRVTRFHNTMQKFGVKSNAIEMLFARIETAWRTKKYKRKYFLSLKFLVFNLSLFFGYNLRETHGASIKDPNRLKKQQIILHDLLKSVDVCKADRYYFLLGIHL